MQAPIQTFLDQLSQKYDSRVSVFEPRVSRVADNTVSVDGRLLEHAQLTALKEAFALQFPDLKLDSSSVKILGEGEFKSMHVKTNLTGFYEQPTFGVPLLSELYFGWELEVLDQKGRWVFARQKNGYLGWAYGPYLEDGAPKAATHLVLSPSIELRAEATNDGPIVSRLVSGTGVILQKTQADWSFVSANESGWVPSASLRAVADLAKTKDTRHATLIADSARLTGTPYLWGGLSGNGIDCSGFVYLLHRWIGVEIPRDADMQCNAAKPVEPPFAVGTLLFFGEGDSDRKVTHVGMSLGGWKMIHSSRGRNGVYVDDVQQKQSLMEIYMSAGTFI